MNAVLSPAISVFPLPLMGRRLNENDEPKEWPLIEMDILQALKDYLSEESATRFPGNHALNLDKLMEMCYLLKVQLHIEKAKLLFNIHIIPRIVADPIGFLNKIQACARGQGPSLEEDPELQNKAYILTRHLIEYIFFERNQFLYCLPRELQEWLLSELHHLVPSAQDPSDGCDPDRAASEPDAPATRAQEAQGEYSFLLGLLHLYGPVDRRDYALAVQEFTKAAEWKFAPGHHMMGICYWKGLGVNLDRAPARQHFEKAASLGCGRGLVWLAFSYGVNVEEVERDCERAFQYSKQAADAGCLDGVLEMGRCHLHGIGVEQDAVKAVEYFQQAADKGSAQGFLLLGKCWEVGKGVPQNKAKAVACYEQAADRGDADGYLQLGNYYRLQSKESKQAADKAADSGSADASVRMEESIEWGMWWALEDKAWKYWQKAIELGSAEASLVVGTHYLRGTGIVERDEAKAVEYFQRAADLGSAQGFLQLGRCLEQGKGVPQDKAKAIACYKQAADRGDADGYLQLGVAYEQGREVQQDTAKAIACYKQAADLGSAESCMIMGAVYAQGIEVQKDEEEAAKYFAQAADLGSATAHLELGKRYVEGLGVMRNPSLGVAHYQRARNLGLAEGSFQLGICYEAGKGVNRDDVQAFKYYVEAADRRSAQGCLKVGNCYLTARGVEGNDVMGWFWYQRAVEKGCKAAYHNMGYCYEAGRGTPKNMKKALECYEQAMDLHMDSKYKVAVLLIEGCGEEIVQDKSRGLELLRELERQHYPQASAVLEQYDPQQPSKRARTN